jgi:hypothetical protein
MFTFSGLDAGFFIGRYHIIFGTKGLVLPGTFVKCKVLILFLLFLKNQDLGGKSSYDNARV